VVTPGTNTSFWVATTGGASLSAGTTSGQVYLTGASGAVPTTPVTVTGDVAINSAGVTTIQAGAVTSAKIAAATITASNIASSTITGAKIASGTITASNLSTTGTASATTFLNGNFQWATPSGGSPIVMGGAKSGTVTLSNTANQSTLYVIADNATITLPSAPTSGQEIILVDGACSASNNGFTLDANTSQTLLIPTGSGAVPGTSVPIFCDTHLVYDGSNGTWYGIGASI
jgi:hypothetical protein